MRLLGHDCSHEAINAGLVEWIRCGKNGLVLRRASCYKRASLALPGLLFLLSPCDLSLIGICHLSLVAFSLLLYGAIYYVMMYPEGLYYKPDRRNCLILDFQFLTL